jgi:hypothetical protein
VKETAPSRVGPRGALVRNAIGALLVFAFLGGLIALGRWGRAQLEPEDRFRFRLGDIQCAAPPGLSRQEFLAEVRYLSRTDEAYSALDPQLEARLRPLFEAHPWVERFGGVAHEGAQHVVVHLSFRRPVLAVAWNGSMRAVDRQGVLLPESAPTNDLPRFAGKPAPPRGPAGMPWGDPQIARQAKAVMSRE